MIISCDFVLLMIEMNSSFNNNIINVSLMKYIILNTGLLMM